MKVAVIGLGYVGSVTAAGLSAAGHDVLAHDIDGARAEALVLGRPVFHEPGLAELLAAGSGRLRTARTVSDAVREAAVVFVCVQTPARRDGIIDLQYVESAVRDVVSVDRTGTLVIAIRSTVVPGTSDDLDRRLLGPLRAGGRDVEIVVNPEFLREGRAVMDHMTPDRIVVGAASGHASDVLRELYGDRAPVLVMSRSSAELAKYSSNALLATLVSFSNELADLAEAVEGTDVIAALRALHLDRRWTELEGDWRPGILRYLWPGAGYGGSCLPKDVKALVAAGREHGAEMTLLRAVDAINERRARHIADLIAGAVDLRGTQISILGTAFKEGTDDVRDSPGLRLSEELRSRGAKVVTYDPLVRSEASPDVITAAKVCVLMTWAAELSALADEARSRGAIVVDARRQLPLAAANDRQVIVGRG